MMTNYKRINITLITIIYFIIIFVPSVIYIKDPYEIFHKSKIEKNMNPRIQNYSIINYKNFDSIIFGASEFAGFTAEKTNKQLNNIGNFISLSYPASSYYERLLTINYAFSKKKIKNIIYSINFLFFFNEKKKINPTFYSDLYRNKISGKWEVYFNSQSLKCVFLNKNCFLEDILDKKKLAKKINFEKKSLIQSVTEIEKNNNLNTNIVTENKIKDDSNDNIIFQILATIKNKYSYQNGIKTADYKEIVDDEILILVKNHPETQFYFIIPPMNIIYWKILENKRYIYFDILKYLLEQSKSYKNLKVYWFYDEKFIYDNNYYGDVFHYTPIINDFIINAIKNEKNIININNYFDKINEFDKNINDFSISEYEKALNM